MQKYLSQTTINNSLVQKKSTIFRKYVALFLLQSRVVKTARLF